MWITVANTMSRYWYKLNYLLFYYIGWYFFYVIVLFGNFVIDHENIFVFIHVFRYKLYNRFT